MADAFFWLAVLCCVVAQVAITRSAFRTPGRAEGAGDVPLPHRVSEIAWTLIPAVGLALVLMVTWHVIHLPSLPPFFPPGSNSAIVPVP
ncbi:MAG TPA: hypothetical protein VFW98_11105 [Gemmatimonadaceae bacterium]|nr:hypothetical protein [Gemmatimonadaceae bacterium]